MKESIPGYPIFDWLNAGKINLFTYVFTVQLIL